MIETRHQREIRSIAWLEQNARLLTGGGDGQIRLTDCATGTIVAVAENVDRRTVHDLAVLPGDRAVLAACAWDLRLKLYDIDGLRFVHEIGGHELRSDNMLLCAAVNGDGTRAVTGAADGLVMLWDVAERRCLATFRGHEGGVRAVAIDSSGDWIASGGVDHTVRVWDVRRTEAERTLSGHTEPVWCVAVTDGGRSIASGSYDGTLRLWRGRRATSRWRTDGPALAVRLIDDGSHLVAAVRGRGVVRIEHAPLPL
jgi:WD40 repeat protein